MEKEEIIEKLEAKIEKYKEMNDLGELMLSYSILVDVCKAKASEELEEEDVNLEVVDDWEKKANEYKQLEKRVKARLNIEKRVEIENEVLKNPHLLILHMRSRELHALSLNNLSEGEDKEKMKIHKKLKYNDCEDGYIFDDIVDKIIENELKDIKINY